MGNLLIIYYLLLIIIFINYREKRFDIKITSLNKLNWIDSVMQSLKNPNNVRNSQKQHSSGSLSIRYISTRYGFPSSHWDDSQNTLIANNIVYLCVKKRFDTKVMHFTDLSLCNSVLIIKNVLHGLSLRQSNTTFWLRFW